ncbi:phospholipase [Candidatus Woesearchaeota archaeon]|nr:phospholipase [Candidatus Woesearchaeota archaeon]
MKAYFALIFGIAAVLAVSCSQEPTRILPQEYGIAPIAMFCPEQDCGGNLEFMIESSRESVHCAFFDLDLENVIMALAKKSKEADVKIVMDSDNYDRQIKGNVVLDDRNQLMHNKFCVFDKSAVWTGSFNPTHNGNERNNNNVIVLYSGILAQNYEDEFGELWNKTFSSGQKTKNPRIIFNNKKIENFFCPDDKCEDEAIRHIRKANSSIYFMAFSFTSERIADELLFNGKAEIKGVVEKRNANGQGSQFGRLKDFGIDVKLDSNPYSMHHKVFVIDREIVITGSYNPTSAGAFRNDENIIIIHDREIAEKFIKEFEKVYAASG